MTPSRRCATWGATAAAELRAALGDVAELLLPGACAGCGVCVPKLWCGACARGLRLVRGPCCPCCGAPWRPAQHGRSGCGRCRRFGRPFAFRRARALWHHAGPARRAVHAFKYHGRADLLRPLGRAMAADVRVGGVLAAEAPRIVVPLPARRRSRQARGYDQAVGLAEGLATGLGLPVWRVLMRRREPPRAQARQPLAERRRLVRAAFEARVRDLQGRRVLLVDDVLSTGASVDAAARALRLAGAGDVLVATLAS